MVHLAQESRTLMATSNQAPPRYGGRALRNGVMMMGPRSVAVAVRKADGQIATAVEPFHMPGQWSRNIPFVRGLVSFGGMMKLAKLSSRLEARLNEGGSRVNAIIPQLAPGIGAAIADRLTGELARRADPRLVFPIEAIGGVALPFVAFGISGKMPGVDQVWRYHGAEHKAVRTAEAGLDLTPENATTMSRVHPRCGTVLAFWGLLGGMIAKSQVEKMPNGRGKAIAGALSGPMILAAAYELSRLGAQVSEHPVGKLVFGPAWQTQRLTTAEPNESELEVALAALQAVIDYGQVEA
jgi:uncharacterized protein YqhQ